MDLIGKQEVIRKYLTKDVIIQLCNEKGEIMICFNPKNCSRIFFDQNYLKLESYMYQNAGLFNLYAFSEVRVVDNDKCDNEDN